MRIRTHPGEVLGEEFLKPYELSARELAEYLVCPQTGSPRSWPSVAASRPTRRFDCRVFSQPRPSSG